MNVFSAREGLLNVSKTAPERDKQQHSGTKTVCFLFWVLGAVTEPLRSPRLEKRVVTGKQGTEAQGFAVVARTQRARDRVLSVSYGFVFVPGTGKAFGGSLRLVWCFG